jgi:hypothetical protein
VLRAKAALRALYREPLEGRRWVREGGLYFALIHVQLAAVLAGVLPRWTLPLLLPLWMARLVIGRHELLHACEEDDVDAFTRLWPMLMMVAPLSPGFRELRVYHQRHHQLMLTTDDPDWDQMRGSKLRGFLHCLISPEVTLERWICENGVDRALLRDVVLRAVFFVGVAVSCGRLFIWYWLPLRLTYGAALFLFSYVPHRRGPRYGVFRIEPGPAGVALLSALFSRAGWLALCNHDLHHMNGNLSPLRLRAARAIVEPKPSFL